MKLLFAILVTMVPYLTNAQSIRLESWGPVCLGGTHQIKGIVSGTFATDNRFIVQVRTVKSPPILAEIPSNYKNGVFETVYRDSSLSLLPSLQCRVIATSPYTESNWVKNYQVFSKGVISMGLTSTDTINRGDDLSITFNTFSSQPVKVTLSNGLLFTIPGQSTGFNESIHKIAVSDTGAIRILKAQNVCGPMLISGIVEPVFNPVSIRAHLIEPYLACEDTDVRVGISISGEGFTPKTQYRLRFTRITSTGGLETAATVDAFNEDGFLVAKIPRLNQTSASRYQVQIVTEYPSTLSPPATETLTVAPRPYASFDMPGDTLESFQKGIIKINFSGLPPYSARISNGIQINAENEIRNTSVAVFPLRTTTYKLESFTTGCEDKSRPGVSSIVFARKPGIGSDGSAITVCAGSWGKIPFMANVPEESKKAFKVYGYMTSSGRFYTFEARLSGDSLEFYIPEIPESSPYYADYDHFNRFEITTGDSKYSTGVSIKVVSRPRYTIATSSVLNYTKPQWVNLNYQLTGIGPFEIEYGDNQKEQVVSYTWGPKFNVVRDTTFTIKSISNQCFKTEKELKSKITFKPQPSILLRPNDMFICIGDSIEVNFKSFGDFLPGNEFVIQGSNYCCALSTWGVVSKEGKYKFKYPAGVINGYITVQVSATNPVVASEKLTIQLSRPINTAGARVIPVGSPTEPYTVANTNLVPVRINSTSGGMIRSLTYSDGLIDSTVYTPNINFRTPLGKLKTFTIKSITGDCGTYPVNLTTTIVNAPYRLSFPYYFINVTKTMKYFCLGRPAFIPFAVVEGNTNDKTTFSLELARSGETSYRTIASEESSASRGFYFYFPEDLAAGVYFVRVVSSDGAVSVSIPTTIRAPAVATVSSDEPQPIKLNLGDTFNMEYVFGGSSPYSVVFDDNSSRAYITNSGSKVLVATRTGNYSLKSVSNACGYGKIDGDVKIELATYPVSLISFEATAQEERANLTWRTSEEMNSDYFLIERSSDGQAWHSLGEVPAAGESIGSKIYTFADGRPATGQNLYRLKMVDRDGTFSYSRIAVLFFEPAKDLIFYPNPASTELKLQFGRDLESIKSIRIKTFYGVEVYYSEKVNTNRVDIKKLVSGGYILEIELSDGEIRTNRFVKLNSE